MIESKPIRFYALVVITLFAAALLAGCAKMPISISRNSNQLNDNNPAQPVVSTVTDPAAAEKAAAEKSALDQANAEKAAYLAKYDWHDDEMGVSVDSLTARPGSSQGWNEVDIKGRIVSADRDYSFVTIKMGIYKGGILIGNKKFIVSDVKRRTDCNFEKMELGFPLPTGDLTWQIESLYCDDENYIERHYFGPEKESTKSIQEINANYDRYTDYNQFGILRDPGSFYTISGDNYLVDIKGKAVRYGTDGVTSGSGTIKFGIYSGGSRIGETSVSFSEMKVGVLHPFSAKKDIPAAQVTGELTYQVEEILSYSFIGKEEVHYIKP